jgi:choice-of-anchor B domain-containing protein
MVIRLAGLIFCLFLSAPGMDALAQQQWNMPLLSRWDNDSIPEAWTGAYSECGGYSDGSGGEYAYIGSTQGIYFFNITDPVHPVMVDYFPTRDTVALVVNKDFAVYQHYVYAVSDQGNNSLQIFDMQYLPDSVVKVYDSDSLSKRCHTLYVNNDRLYMCSNSRPNNTFGAMDVFSLADPIHPVLLGTLFHPGFFSVHETFVRNDTAWCSNGNNGLWIYDMSDPAVPGLIAIIDQYPEDGYNHSGWLTADSRTLIFTDENHGKGVKVYDVSDPSNPELKSIFRSNLLQLPDPQSANGSVAHNPFIVNDKLFLAYYHDGVQVYDLRNPWAPEWIGYYDTYPENDTYFSYAGCWGVYPFLPSGTIIAGDIKNGLFLLDGSKVLTWEPSTDVEPDVQVLGNPVNTQLLMGFSLAADSEIEITVFNSLGQLVLKKQQFMLKGRSETGFPAQSWSSGVYFVRVSGGGMEKTLPVVVGGRK